MFSAKACGKLYLAGEYAVVFGGRAVLTPVKKYLTVRIKKSESFCLKRTNYDEDFVFLDLNQPAEEHCYVAETLNWFGLYLKEFGKTLEPVQLEIETELETPDNKKYGFGSSAAVVVALLRALSRAFQCNFDSWQLYKAGVLISSKVSKESSFGDLACIAFEKTIEYKKFNLNLDHFLSSKSQARLLDEGWSGLLIQEFDFPHPILVVHTNQAASSSKLVAMVRKYREAKEFEEFLSTSEKLVASFVTGSRPLLEVIQDLDQNLRRLAALTKAPLFIPAMQEIEEVVRAHRGAMKFSGAGGGDCVLCFFDEPQNRIHAQQQLHDCKYETIIFKEEKYESQR